MPDLNIQLLQPVNEEITNNLTKNLKNITGYSTIITETFSDLTPFFVKDRHQYNAIKIIESFDINEFDKNILIVSEDLFIPIFTFVFGLAKLNGNMGIVSMHRLNNIFYGLPEDLNLLNMRVIKEIVHELGHLQGLKHCEKYDCVMAGSTVVEELDIKNDRYCTNCISEIKTISILK